MKTVGVDDLSKGDLVMVRWLDASDLRCSISEHVGSPEVYCKDWGIFLGVSGRKRRLMILGKDVVEVHNEWGATRIPVDLVDEVLVVLSREDAVKAIREIQTLGRRVRIRKYVGEVERLNVD